MTCSNERHKPTPRSSGRGWARLTPETLIPIASRERTTKRSERLSPDRRSPDSRPDVNLRFAQAGRSDWPRIWPLWHRVGAAGDTSTFEPDSSMEEGADIWLPGTPAQTWYVVG